MSRLLRKDLEELAAHARGEGLYSTLVTSGLGLTRARAERLKEAGLEHIQISIQDSDPDVAERIAGVRSVKHKQAAAALVRELGFAFTINVCSTGPTSIESARSSTWPPISEPTGSSLPIPSITDGDSRTGRRSCRPGNRWTARGRSPSEPSSTTAAGCRSPTCCRTTTSRIPKACYGGWGKLYLVVTPNGMVLPCHGATQITTLRFDDVRSHSLEWIWRESEAFRAFRGDSWMKEPCRSCPRKATDFGGCRCQAFALTGDAANTDPVCTLTPLRQVVDEALTESSRDDLANTATVPSPASPNGCEPHRAGHRDGGAGARLRQDQSARRPRPRRASQCTGGTAGAQRGRQDHRNAPARHPVGTQPRHALGFSATTPRETVGRCGSDSGSCSRKSASTTCSPSRRTFVSPLVSPV